jgi:hypothetical protein
LREQKLVSTSTHLMRKAQINTILQAGLANAKCEMRRRVILIQRRSGAVLEKIVKIWKFLLVYLQCSPGLSATRLGKHA